MPSLTPELRAALVAIVGERGVVDDAAATLGYARDQAALAPSGSPLAVVRPSSTEQVVGVVRALAAARVPIVPRGAGTGLAGGANAVDGAVTLCVDRMDRIVDLDPVERTITVQPGVLNAQVTAAAAEAGLWYPPDPASWEISSIGGNLATNAGGLCCVKYGVTRDAVLGLEVVLADGSTARLGRRTVKGVAGLDLVGLFVGSEGTLGLITEATLKLRRPAPPATTLVASFPTPAAAGAAIVGVLEDTEPSMLEIVDRTTLRAIEQHARMGLDTEAGGLLLAQSDLAGAPGEAEVARMRARCERAGADLVVVTSDPQEAEALLAARRLAYPALERLGTTLLDDVAVPRGRIIALIDRVERIAEQHGVLIGTFGHAGDGNLHPTIVFDAADDHQRRQAKAAFDAVVAAALDLGGTVTGEHGVGVLKREHLLTELDPGALELHRRIRAALDPLGLLNPGKVLATMP